MMRKIILQRLALRSHCEWPGAFAYNGSRRACLQQRLTVIRLDWKV